MAGAAEEPFDEHAVVAEGAAGLTPCRSERVVELVRGLGDAHAATTTARGGLNQQRVRSI
jgi:hypothetical protein